MKNLENLVAECGVELYDSEIVSEFGKRIFRIYITKPGGVNLDDCERVSTLLSPIFDVEAPVEGEYFLEVSSPGIERNLKEFRHFKASLGENVKIKTAEFTITGELISADENQICVKNGEEIHEINLSEIKKARTFVDWDK